MVIRVNANQMQKRPAQPRTGLFFIVGPLRTGSSLMSRCIDDHENVVCLCESEVNRALYQTQMLDLHVMRMLDHGFTYPQIIKLLDRKKQDDFQSLIQWYSQVIPLAKAHFQKPDLRMLGDKSPDFFTSDELVSNLANRFRLIYTVRDPRAIMRSIQRQDVAPREKIQRWQNLIGNIKAWEPYLDQPNLLVSRYEDLINKPQETMDRVYQHLGLPQSSRFLEGFERQNPKRFLWTTAIDWQSGVRKDFDPKRAQISNDDLEPAQLAMIYDDPTIVRFMKRFGYLPQNSLVPKIIVPLTAPPV